MNAVEIGVRRRLPRGAAGCRRRAAWGRGLRTFVAVVGLAEHRREPPRETAEREREPERDATRRRPRCSGAMSASTATSPPNTTSTPIQVVARRRSPRAPMMPTIAPDDGREQAAHEHALVPAEHDGAHDHLDRADRDERRGRALELAPVEHRADGEERDPEDERDRGRRAGGVARRPTAACRRSTARSRCWSCRSRSRSGTG